MSKKNKATLLVIAILLCISLIISASYAYYIFSVSQSGSNVVRSDCFEITFSDGDAISINDGVPLTDNEAKELTPYTFTIKNICNNVMEYNINIETLNSSDMDLNAIATKIDSKQKKILGSFNDNDTSSIINNNISSSKTIYTDILKANEQKTHNLRLWVDEDATVAQSANKTFSSKVVVNAKLIPNYKEAVLKDGKSTNVIMKKTSGYSDATLYTYDKATKYIKMSNNPPTEEDDAVNIADSTSDTPVYVWFDTDTLYYYTEASKIFLNKTSNCLFYRFWKVLSIDLTKFDTSRVENMESLFGESPEITELDLSNFDTSNALKMGYMFSGMSNIQNLDFSSFDTSKVNDMEYMFNSTNKLEYLDLSSFDTSNVQNMRMMFRNNISLKTLIIDKNFNTSKVVNMEQMFKNVTNIENFDLITNFDTSRVTNMNSMFDSMKITTLDLSNFDTSNVTNMGNTFSNITNLTTIKVSNKFVTTSVTESTDMFVNSTNLVGGAGTTYDAEHVDVEYARVDGGTSNPGYFTLKTN